MDITKLPLHDLESYYNLVCKIRDGIVMMARANNNMNTPQFRKINEIYSMVYNEIMNRLDKLCVGEAETKEVLNEEVAR